jgi:hypothetical protein
MNDKTYAVELTADEVARLLVGPGAVTCVSVRDKLKVAWDASRSDREAAELLLPWSAECDGRGWCLRRAGQEAGALMGCERAAKLASAAPELLDAARAAQMALRHTDTASGSAERLEVVATIGRIERAIRKAETGEL